MKCAVCSFEESSNETFIHIAVNEINNMGYRFTQERDGEPIDFKGFSQQVYACPQCGTLRVQILNRLIREKSGMLREKVLKQQSIKKNLPREII